MSALVSGGAGYNGDIRDKGFFARRFKKEI